jgi:peptidoglycan-associated lipoprotein
MIKRKKTVVRCAALAGAALLLLAGCKSKKAGGEEIGRGNFPAIDENALVTKDGQTVDQDGVLKTIGEEEAALREKTRAQIEKANRGFQNVAEQGSVDVKETGAPIPELPPVFFDYDEAVLTPAAIAQLDKNGAYLKSRTDMMVVLRGHTDEMGTEEYNLALGSDRAQAVREYLVNELQIEASRLDTVSFGESMKLAEGEDDASLAQNRRVEFFVYLSQ